MRLDLIKDTSHSVSNKLLLSVKVPQITPLIAVFSNRTFNHVNKMITYKELTHLVLTDLCIMVMERLIQI